MNGSARHSSALPVARGPGRRSRGSIGPDSSQLCLICTRRPLCEGFTVVPLGQVLLSDALNVVGHLGRSNFVRSKLAPEIGIGAKGSAEVDLEPLDSLAVFVIH